MIRSLVSFTLKLYQRGGLLTGNNQGRENSFKAISLSVFRASLAL